MFLTAKQVQHLKPDRHRRQEVPVGPPGLYLIVQPSGKKSWAVRYRWHGKPRKLTLTKPYPSLSLAAARAEADAALSNIERGIDPMAAKASVISLASNGVHEVAEEWLGRAVRPNTRTWREVERIINKEIKPPWKHKLITEVGRADVLRLLDSIVDRGAPILANRVRSILLRWFGWCLERGYLEASPVASIRPVAAERTRERVLTEHELREAWKAANLVSYPFGPFIRVLILTAQRRGEVASMRWEDVDVKAAMWTLPSEATKAGRVHDVPLSKQVLEILGSLPRFQGPYVFTTTSGVKPINGFTKMRAALDTKIIESREKQSGEKSSDRTFGWTIHDLRRTAATNMAKVGVPPHILSAILNHTPGSTQGVTMIYNRFRYTEERRAALAEWANYVLTLSELKRKSAVG